MTTPAIADVLAALADFARAATFADFEQMFGRDLGARQWARFCEAEYDVIRWYGRLTASEQAVFALALNDHLRRQGSRAAQPVTVTRRRQITYVLREPVCAHCGHELISGPNGEPACGECDT